MARRKSGKRLAPNDPRRKGIANLKPIKPGEVRNPEGRNGSEWLKGLRDFFDGKAPPTLRGSGLKVGSGATRFDVLVEALYRRIQAGSDSSIKLATEQLAGRARQQIEVTGPGGAPLAGGVPVTLYLPDNKRGPAEPKADESREGDAGAGGGDEPTGA